MTVTATTSTTPPGPAPRPAPGTSTRQTGTDYQMFLRMLTAQATALNAMTHLGSGLACMFFCISSRCHCTQPPRTIRLRHQSRHQSAPVPALA